MIEVTFILPKPDGFETPLGEVFKYSCLESDSLGSLFGVVSRRTGIEHVRLSLVANGGPTQALRAIDPRSQESVGSLGLTGVQLLVGWKPKR